MDRLERAVHERTRALEERNSALNQALTQLQEAQSELVRQEKLASLGRLVAGVAHEINTPLGICVTATSHLVEELRLTRAELADGEMTEDSLASFFDVVDQSLRIMTTNTQRAAAWCAVSSRWRWTSPRTISAASTWAATSMRCCCRCSPSSRGGR
jgi:two-component system NtrC family sensor kinase